MQCEEDQKASITALPSLSLKASDDIEKAPCELPGGLATSLESSGAPRPAMGGGATLARSHFGISLLILAKARASGVSD